MKSNFFQSLQKESWEEVRLGDIIDIKHGWAFKGEFITTEPNNNILVTPGNFHIGGGFKSNKFKYYKGNFPAEYILKENDIVVTMTDLSKEGDTLGFSAKIPKNNDFVYLHNQRIGLVKFICRPDDICKDFIYWLMRSRNYQQFIVGAATGTSVRHTSPTLIKSFTFNIPPLKTQEKIAQILSSFDDKIDLLHKQNKTLETLAQTLFRHHFIENAKESWEVGKLGDEFEFVMGVSPEGKSYNTEKQGMPMFQGNADFDFRFPNNRIYTTKPKKMAQKFDTLISVRAPVGVLNMAKEECCIGRGLSAFRYKHDINLRSYTFYKLNSLSCEIQQFNDKGTVFGSISKGDFENIQILIPPQNFARNLNKKLATFDDKIYHNSQQIQNLEAMRDIILKKIFA